MGPGFSATRANVTRWVENEVISLGLAGARASSGKRQLANQERMGAIRVYEARKPVSVLGPITVRKNPLGKLHVGSRRFIRARVHGPAPPAAPIPLEC
jgi:hypothetical protein